VEAARPKTVKRVLSHDLLILRDALRVMLLRELRAIDRQIAAYPDDASVWQTPPGISNSAGTLALHAAGNLRHFIGAVLGNSGYVRNREAEFSTKGLSREALRAEVQAAITHLDRAFGSIGAAQLEVPYPLLVQERRVRTADFLAHLAVHLGYHLGQIDYHRRLLTPDPQAVAALSVAELAAYEDDGGA
jgi:uncharacterized damage-inducible protein DinB